MRALGRPLLSSFVVSLSNPNVFPVLAGNSCHNSQWSIPHNEVQNFNVLTSSVSITSEIFYDIVRGYKKNRRLITNNIENRYSELVNEVVINRFPFKMQLLSATRQNSGEFIFHQDFHSAQDTLVF